MILPRSMIKTLKSSKKPWIIVFSSFVHGSGKSTLSKMLEDLLRRMGIRVYRLCTGEIFRRIAVSKKETIDELLEELKNNSCVDLEIDAKVYCIVKNLRRKNYYNCILVDSSVAPYYLRGPKTVKIYVYSNLKFVAKRLLKSRRIGDSKFYDESDVIKSLLERSAKDYRRYKKLSKLVTSKFWKNVYASYGKQIFDLMHDNSRSLQDSLRILLKEINHAIKVKARKRK